MYLVTVCANEQIPGACGSPPRWQQQALATGAALAAQELTFYRDVLPILQNRCQTCHRPAGQNLGGLVAPMSLTTYEEVRPWARAIVRRVQAREMPPWFTTDHTKGVFSNERGLADEEIKPSWPGSVPEHARAGLRMRRRHGCSSRTARAAGRWGNRISV